MPRRRVLDAAVVVEDVDMKNDDDDVYCVNDDDVEIQSKDTNAEIQTFLLQLKLQLDLRDSEENTVDFEYVSPNTVLVKCFVPLPRNSSMLPLIPLIMLRMAFRPGNIDAQIMSNTHIYLPLDLVVHDPHAQTYHLRVPSISNISAFCKRYGDQFIRIVPKLVQEFIQQVQLVRTERRLASRYHMYSYRYCYMDRYIMIL